MYQASFPRHELKSREHRRAFVRGNHHSRAARISTARDVIPCCASCCQAPSKRTSIVLAAQLFSSRNRSQRRSRNVQVQLQLQEYMAQCPHVVAGDQLPLPYFAQSLGPRTARSYSMQRPNVKPSICTVTFLRGSCICRTAAFPLSLSKNRLAISSATPAASFIFWSTGAVEDVRSGRR